MEFESRSQRFKWLHDQVNREISASASLSIENEQLASVLEKLDAIDKKFFREKWSQFITEHQLGRPYLETAKENETITEDEVFEMKRIIKELQNVEVSQRDRHEDESEGDNLNKDLFSVENKVFNDNLSSISDWLDKKISEYNAKDIKHNPVIEQVSMSLVQQVRNRDPRDMNELSADLVEVNKDIDFKRMRAHLFIARTKQFRFVKVVLPILIIALVLIAVGIALVLVL